MIFFPKDNSQIETDYLFQQLCKAMQPSKGSSNTLFEEMQQQYITWQPNHETPNDYKMAFGRYKGWFVKHIPPDYMQWFIKQQDNDHQKLTQYMSDILKERKLLNN